MSVVVNGGFEDPLAAEQSPGNQPLSIGAWTPARGGSSSFAPDRVTSEKNSGTYGLRTRAQIGSQMGNWVLQDFPSSVVDPENGIYLSCNVKIVSGDVQLQLLLDYDRGIGNAVGFLMVNMAPTLTTFRAWSSQADTDSVPHDGVWRNIALRSWPDGSADFLISGTVVHSFGPQAVPNFSIATILIGEGSGIFHAYVDEAYWDDVSLDFSPYPTSSGSNISLRQRQKLVNSPRARQRVR